MRYRNRILAIASCCLVSSATLAHGQTNSKIVTGPDGVTYQETRTVTQRLLPTTEYQATQQQVLTPHTTTTYQSYQQNYLTPVTEYRWVSRRRGILNPFVQPYWAHRMEPVTRWENKPVTVQVPVTNTQWVAGTRTVHTPVTKYKTVQEEQVSRVALSAAPATTLPGGSQPATAVASRVQLSPIGGQKMESDPPRTANGWNPTTSSGGNRYR